MGETLGDGKYNSALVALGVTAILSLIGVLVYKFVIKDKK
jgi:hypothetical protein